MQIEWADQATDDLDNIYIYIARDAGLDIALQVIDRIDRAVTGLNHFPEKTRNGRIANTRELVIPNLPYIVPFTISDGRIRILRVYHTSRQWPEQIDS